MKILTHIAPGNILLAVSAAVLLSLAPVAGVAAQVLVPSGSSHSVLPEVKGKPIQVDSFYMDAGWTDHRGDTYSLSDFTGKPVIVVMFYGNCTQVYPILVQDTWRLYSMLDEVERPSIHVLAITFDIENDTLEVLRRYAEYEQLNIPGWHFMTTTAASVRSLAMMLGVQYSKKSDGHFAHSNLVTVLDKQGRIATRIEGLNQPMDKAAKTISSLIPNSEEQ